MLKRLLVSTIISRKVGRVALLCKKFIVLLWSGTGDRQHFPVDFDGGEIQNPDGLHGHRNWVWVRVATIDTDRVDSGHNSSRLLWWFIPGSSATGTGLGRWLLFLCLFPASEGVILADRNLLWTYLLNRKCWYKWNWNLCFSYLFRFDAEFGNVSEEFFKFLFGARPGRGQVESLHGLCAWRQQIFQPKESHDCVADLLMSCSRNQL